MILVNLAYGCASSLLDALFGHLFSKILLPSLESCHNQEQNAVSSEIIELFTLSSSKAFKICFWSARKYLYSSSVLFNSFNISGGSESKVFMFFNVLAEQFVFILF